MLVESLAPAPQADVDITDRVLPADRDDPTAGQAWRRVGSVDHWPLFGRLLVWATRNNHPRPRPRRNSSRS